MRSFTPIQLAAAVALLGSLLAVFIPTFSSNLRASKLAEPLDGLSHIAGAATALAAGLPTVLAYPESVTRTPTRVPAGQAVVDPPGTWDHPTWRLLDFTKEREHAYAFEFESHASAEQASFVARAHGDLDGDGELSEFSIAGEVRGSAAPVVYPLRLRREVE
ncbi:MAG TPA: hypothetical protein VLC09_00020 [Polyangiaceae bacterium]|nr:hypothetical protein [Polyangiaceae bacterium]